MSRSFLKALLPEAVQVTMRKRLHSFRAKRRDRFLRRHLHLNPLRIVIGSSGVFEPGWIPTDAEQLNLLREECWASYFQPDSIDALLAEHVWEHLTLDDGRLAARVCYRYLKPGGYIRVAVPDGLHPDPSYREYIKPGGAAGGPVGGHLVAYTYKDLVSVFESAGFTTRLLEYHDESGKFHVEEWNAADGMIHRSVRFDPRGAVSIVLDARK